MLKKIIFRQFTAGTLKTEMLYKNYSYFGTQF